EDGIRDRNVTGVQTCALPIYWSATTGAAPPSSTGGTLASTCASGNGSPSLRTPAPRRAWPSWAPALATRWASSARPGSDLRRTQDRKSVVEGKSVQRGYAQSE